MEKFNENRGISIIDSVILFFQINICLIIYSIPFTILARCFKNHGLDVAYVSIEQLGTIVAYIFIIKKITKRFKSQENFKLKIEYKPTLKECIFVIISILGYNFVFDNTIGILLQNIPEADWFKNAFMEIGNEPLVLQFISLCVIAPIFEEIIYRGIMLEELNKRCGAVKAILISALFFGIMHLNLHQAVNGFFIGIVMGFIYIKADSFILTILLHFLNNLYCLIVLNIPYLDKIESNFSIFRLICGVILLFLVYRFFNNSKIDLDRKFNLRA
ncbi:CPBP family intramembrane glutamic endopeptidase [Clostridium botulinum]|uniref:CPBP family intramembrane glutamic endopeptidase n=1 Tax=Clostridium botulinum TaxID=1491 RepID=UPI000D13B8A5|nr:CPBP family intramembrane glutamic endopeptidase [Clostridium botulinum]AVQ45398.1 CPBP family intramembrane metalloprotease [Clostridium botulinum]AVQ49232.1 CPBP family intramembrane metalloprotease [Clostridium botulinum]